MVGAAVVGADERGGVGGMNVADISDRDDTGYHIHEAFIIIRKLMIILIGVS